MLHWSDLSFFYFLYFIFGLYWKWRERGNQGRQKGGTSTKWPTSLDSNSRPSAWSYSLIYGPPALTTLLLTFLWIWSLIKHICHFELWFRNYCFWLKSTETHQNPTQFRFCAQPSANRTEPGHVPDNDVTISADIYVSMARKTHLNRRSHLDRWAAGPDPHWCWSSAPCSRPNRILHSTGTPGHILHRKPNRTS